MGFDCESSRLLSSWWDMSQMNRISSRAQFSPRGTSVALWRVYVMHWLNLAGIAPFCPPGLSWPDPRSGQGAVAAGSMPGDACAMACKREHARGCCSMWHLLSHQCPLCWQAHGHRVAPALPGMLGPDRWALLRISCIRNQQESAVLIALPSLLGRRRQEIKEKLWGLPGKSREKPRPPARVPACV